MVFMMLTLLNAAIKWYSQKGVNDKQKIFGTITLIFAHTQLSLGIILYFISPKVKFDLNLLSSPIIRFFTIEHIALMLIAITILTIGNRKIKTTKDALKVSKLTLIWFSIAFVIILFAIPWPFRNLGAGWL